MPIHDSSSGWVLTTRDSMYAFGVNASGRLTHRYWGAKLPRLEDVPPSVDSVGWASFNGPAEIVPEEYPGYGGSSYVEPCLKVTFHDGVRDVVLAFQGSEIRDGELRLSFHDAQYALLVTLHYRVHEDLDLIERRVTLENRGTEAMTVERAFSAQWHFPQRESYRLSHLAGRWLEETQLVREPLTPGLKILESRRLTTSHHHNPWFAVDRLNNEATEESGAVWFGVLAWSGNWKLSAEVTAHGGTRVSLGINDWDSALRLEAGERFVTPSSLAGFTAEGFGGASRRLHTYARGLLPHGDAPHKVLYNSWEATYFDVNEHSQVALAEIAARIGVELFVLDDGWFHRRHSDNAGLGDWWPDAEKFPNGLTPLIDRVQALGMEFGLWLEPEMVNPDSDLYRAHPDWVIHFPTRERTPMRNQLILNLARDDVQDHLIALIDDLLSRHDIRFIKWDMNRNVSEPGWMERREPRELWVRYVEGLYRVWGTLRERHPQVVWQSCSGGGGRADLGMLRFVDQFWTSDNTDPVMRLRIQEGFSQVFPANTMEAWVTEMGARHLSLEFRFHVSMTGSLGVGANLLRWNDAERTEATRLIALYKEIRDTVQQGNQYRLQSAFQSSDSSVLYVNQDRSEAVLFAFRTHVPTLETAPSLRLRGLEPSALYRVDGVAEPKSGEVLMRYGLELSLGEFSSVCLRIRRV
jgi:alpha-galactosidase